MSSQCNAGSMTSLPVLRIRNKGVCLVDLCYLKIEYNVQRRIEVLPTHRILVGRWKVSVLCRNYKRDILYFLHELLPILREHINDSC